MNRRVHLCLLVLLFALAVVFQPSQPARAQRTSGAMKAGLAKTVITPEKNLWMAGYANRSKPSEGKIHELYAKALAVQDARGNRAVIVTTDVLGLPRALTSELSEHANKSYGLKREQILFNSSHTHTGPVLKSSLAGAYNLDAAQSALVDEYTQQLKFKLIKLIGEAIKDMSPAKLSYGRGEAPFAMNRRQFNPNAVIIQVAIYRESNGNGTLDAGDTLLGYAAPESGGTWTLTLDTDGWIIGDHTLYAQAEDSYDVLGDPLALALTLI